MQGLHELATSYNKHATRNHRLLIFQCGLKYEEMVEVEAVSDGIN